MTPEQHKIYDVLTEAGWEWWYDGDMDGHGAFEIHMRRLEVHANYTRTIATGVINTLGRFMEDAEPRL